MTLREDMCGKVSFFCYPSTSRWLCFRPPLTGPKNLHSGLRIEATLFPNLKIKRRYIWRHHHFVMSLLHIIVLLQLIMEFSRQLRRIRNWKRKYATQWTSYTFCKVQPENSMSQIITRSRKCSPCLSKSKSMLSAPMF